MTFFDPSPEDESGKSPRTSGAVGPFIAIGLPTDLSFALAGDRPVITLHPDAIESADLDQVTGAVAGCLLLGTQADAMDVIERLVAAKYRGALMILSPPLPNAAMVKRELTALAKGISITLAEL